MPQHFLLSAARTLSLAKVLRLSDKEAEVVFAAIRWPETQGRPVCPACGSDAVYDCRRPNGAPRWRCKDFSLTSDTLFAFQQADAPALPRRRGDLRQRGEGQERAGAVA